jgi:hypothetical protein
LATIFVVTSAFALLLGGMSLIGILPGISLVVAGFIMVVGAGQALLFGGRKPRLASVIVGIGFCTLAIIGISFLTGRALQADLLVLTLPVSFIYGVPSGYIAGVLVGGVFLVADVLRKLFARGEREQIAEEE